VRRTCSEEINRYGIRSFIRLIRSLADTVLLGHPSEPDSDLRFIEAAKSAGALFTILRNLPSQAILLMVARRGNQQARQLLSTGRLCRKKVEGCARSYPQPGVLYEHPTKAYSKDDTSKEYGRIPETDGWPRVAACALR